MSNAKILIIKTGLIETLTFPDGSSYESAIRKKPVSMVKVHTLGAEGNDVGLKAHHGGVDKALFSEKTIIHSLPTVSIGVQIPSTLPRLA